MIKIVELPTVALTEHAVYSAIVPTSGAAFTETLPVHQRAHTSALQNTSRLAIKRSHATAPRTATVRSGSMSDIAALPPAALNGAQLRMVARCASDHLSTFSIFARNRRPRCALALTCCRPNAMPQRQALNVADGQLPGRSALPAHCCRRCYSRTNCDTLRQCQPLQGGPWPSLTKDRGDESEGGMGLLPPGTRPRRR